jgi:hypothetical protein
MLGKLDKLMMLKFLSKNYPISRIKRNNRFKRGIIVENGTYALSDKKEVVILQHELAEILTIVFSCDESFGMMVVSSFLRLD